MIAPVTSHPMTTPRGPAAPEPAAPRGVGQSARGAVQTAHSDGVDLPRNAQGVAARAIARGADPQSVFAGLAALPVAEAAGDVGTPEGDAGLAEDGGEAPATPPTIEP